ncbi:hypothetical protein ISS30_05710 [bacterium]|nr:hypothetical protein [bacterium]
MYKPLIYFDTNVIRDILRKRRDESVELFKKIKSVKYPCVSSIFALMELVESEKSQYYAKKLLLENKKDINQICREYRKCCLDEKELSFVENNIINSEVFDFIELLNLSDENWTIAKKYAFSTNISATDCIHINGVK